LQKVVLSVLVFSILIVGFSSFQDVDAVVPDCSTATLAVNTFYVSSKTGFLHKVVADTAPNTCEIGQIIAQDGANKDAVVTCEDIAIDHTDQKLYCSGFGSILYRLDRTAVAGVVKAFEIGVFKDGGQIRDDLNAFEIDSFGVAYLAGGGPTLDPSAGRFYNVDLTTAVLTLRTAFGTEFISSGDLARDETTNTDMYWTVRCPGLANTVNDCGDAAADQLDRLFLITLGTPDTLTALAVLELGEIFAMDFVQPSLNLCMINQAGMMYETDRNGVKVKEPFAVSPLVEAFGASGNNIGGIIISLNMMSLALAATQTNASWLLLLAISGVAVIAYQFKGNTKSKNKKIKV